MTLVTSDRDLADLNIDTARSYATEANLVAGLTKLGFDKFAHLRVRNREGRWTAVFPLASVYQAHGGSGGYVAMFSQHGFHTLG